MLATSAYTACNLDKQRHGQLAVRHGDDAANYAPSGYTGVIYNQPGALWDIQCDQTLNFYTGANNFFNNAGLVRKSAGTNTTSIQVAFNNSGTVDVESGTISFGGGETSLGGTFQTATNAVINGNLAGTFSGTANWTGGSVIAGSPLTVATNGVLNIGGNVSIYSPLTNNGTVNWQSGTVMVYNYAPSGYTGVIYNQPGALWNIQCDQTLSFYTGANNFFNNAGLVRKSAGTNTTTIGVAFFNSGTLDIESGTISFSGGATSLGGTFQTATRRGH